jgi:hypothetical protein
VERVPDLIFVKLKSSGGVRHLFVLLYAVSHCQLQRAGGRHLINIAKTLQKIPGVKIDALFEAGFLQQRLFLNSEQ